MSESFNPYQEWLGLPGDVTSPNYYELFGLSPRETSGERIAQAADRAKSKVRSFRPGTHAAQWARLLDEIQLAKSCLTDPERRTLYDECLQAADEQDKNSPAEPHPPAAMNSATSRSASDDGKSQAPARPAANSNLYPPTRGSSPSKEPPEPKKNPAEPPRRTKPANPAPAAGPAHEPTTAPSVAAAELRFDRRFRHGSPRNRTG
jgi:hypothetical protein